MPRFRRPTGSEPVALRCCGEVWQDAGAEPEELQEPLVLLNPACPSSLSPGSALLSCRGSVRGGSEETRFCLPLCLTSSWLLHGKRSTGGNGGGCAMCFGSVTGGMVWILLPIPASPSFCPRSPPRIFRRPEQESARSPASVGVLAPPKCDAFSGPPKVRSGSAEVSDPFWPGCGGLPFKSSGCEV